jgi:cyclic pyranopterin phosphate synthase
MPAAGIAKKDKEKHLSFNDIISLVRAGAELGIKKIRLTGGEPLLRKDIIKLVEEIRAVPGIEELAMTTNGLLLSEYAADLKKVGLDRVNISLDTLDREKYYHITRGGDLDKVLQGIETAHKNGLEPVKINTVLMKNFNETEISDLVNMTKNENTDVRFIELMPLGEGISWYDSYYLPGDTVLKKIPQLTKADQEPGGTARIYRLPEGKGKVGLIEAVSHSFCSTCNKIRITSTGKIKPCLHMKEETDIFKLRSDGMSDKEIIMQSIKEKPFSHQINTKQYLEKNMFEIGG